MNLDACKKNLVALQNEPNFRLYRFDENTGLLNKATAWGRVIRLILNIVTFGGQDREVFRAYQASITAVNNGDLKELNSYEFTKSNIGSTLKGKSIEDIFKKKYEPKFLDSQGTVDAEPLEVVNSEEVKPTVVEKSVESDAEEQTKLAEFKESIRMESEKDDLDATEILKLIKEQGKFSLETYNEMFPTFTEIFNKLASKLSTIDKEKITESKQLAATATNIAGEIRSHFPFAWGLDAFENDAYNKVSEVRDAFVKAYVEVGKVELELSYLMLKLKNNGNLSEMDKQKQQELFERIEKVETSLSEFSQKMKEWG